MGYMLDERIINLIKVLIDSEYISINKISELLSVSKRSVYYVIDDLNRLLSEVDIKELKSVYGKGIILSDNQRLFLENIYFNNLEFDSFQLNVYERQSIIYLLIFLNKNKLKKSQLEEKLKFSIFTINNDIVVLNNILKKFSLKISSSKSYGLKIIGNELEKRQAFQYFFSNIYQQTLIDTSILDFLGIDSIKIEEIKSKIIAFGKQYNTRYFESSIKSISILLDHVADNASCINLSNLDSLFNDPYIKINIENESILFKNEFHLDKNNAIYFSVLLSCSRINNEFNKGNEFYDFSNEILNIFYTITGFKITNKEFIKKLSKHLALSYMRYKIGITIDNPLINEIKTKYESEFKIVREISDVLEKRFNMVISDNEVGYITLYFAAFLIDNIDSHSKFRILLVCESGLSTSYLLRKEIANLDSSIKVVGNISINALANYDAEFDLIVSTIPLKTSENYLLVSPILSLTDKWKILEELNNSMQVNKGLAVTDVLDYVKPYVTSSILKKITEDIAFNAKKNVDLYPLIREIMPNKSFINYLSGESLWEEVIKESCQTLYDLNYINEDFSKKLINNINEYGPYMVFKNNYLLGHAPVEFSNKMGLSFSILKKPIFICEQKVEKIIIFSYINENNHLPILNVLYEMFNNKEFNDFIKSNQTPGLIYNEFLKFFKI